MWRAKRDAIRGLTVALAQRREEQRRRRADWRTLRDAMVRGPAAPYFSRYGMRSPAAMETPRADPKS